MENTGKSEVAWRLELIKQQYEAAQMGLSGFAQGSARHIFPNSLQAQMFLQKIGHSIVNALKMFPPADGGRSIVRESGAAR